MAQPNLRKMRDGGADCHTKVTRYRLFPGSNRFLCDLRIPRLSGPGNGACIACVRFNSTRGWGQGGAEHEKAGSAQEAAQGEL